TRAATTRQTSCAAPSWILPRTGAAWTSCSRRASGAPHPSGPRLSYPRAIETRESRREVALGRRVTPVNELVKGDFPTAWVPSGLSEAWIWIALVHGPANALGGEHQGGHPPAEAPQIRP